MGFLDGLKQAVVNALGVNVQKDSVGLVTDYIGTHSYYLGQPQPVDYQILWRMYLQDPLIKACVDRKTNAILADGYQIVSLGSSPADELSAKNLAEKLERMDFTTLLRNIVLQLMIFDNAYIELVRNPSTGYVQELYSMDSRSMRIQYDEHGTPIAYIQWVLGRRVEWPSQGTQMTPMQGVKPEEGYEVTFQPDELLHLKLNQVGSSVYGHSPLTPLILMTNLKLSAELYANEFFKRNGTPRNIYILKKASKEARERFKQSLQSAQPYEDIVTYTGSDDGIETKSLSPSNRDMEFRAMLDYVNAQIMAAQGVPPIAIGRTEGANRSNAQVQLEAFDRMIAGYQREIASKLNALLFTYENWGVNVKFQFNDENKRNRLRDAQIAQLMYSMKGVFDENEVREVLGARAKGTTTIEQETGFAEVARAPPQAASQPQEEVDRAERREFQNPLDEADRMNPDRNPEKFPVMLGASKPNPEFQQTRAMKEPAPVNFSKPSGGKDPQNPLPQSTPALNHAFEKPSLPAKIQDSATALNADERPAAFHAHRRAAGAKPDALTTPQSKNVMSERPALPTREGIPRTLPGPNTQSRRAMEAAQSGMPLHRPFNESLADRAEQTPDSRAKPATGWRHPLDEDPKPKKPSLQNYLLEEKKPRQSQFSPGMPVGQETAANAAQNSYNALNPYPYKESHPANPKTRGGVSMDGRKPAVARARERAADAAPFKITRKSKTAKFKFYEGDDQLTELEETKSKKGL